MALEGVFDNRPGWRSTGPLGKVTPLTTVARQAA